MDLHVLKRSDSELLHIFWGDDPQELAAQLSAQQAFSVSVILSVRGVGGLLRGLKVPGHVRNGWHAISLACVATWVRQEAEAQISRQLEALCAVPSDPTPGAVRSTTASQEDNESEFEMTPSEEAREFGTGGQADTTPSQEQAEAEDMEEAEEHDEGVEEVDLSDTLLQCRPKDADKATLVRKKLLSTIGHDDTRLLLEDYRECSMKSAEGVYRRVFVDSKGQSLKLAPTPPKPDARLTPWEWGRA